MAKVIAQVGPPKPRPPADGPFEALVRSIMYQQLAGAAAATIHGRFLALFDGGFNPKAVLAIAPEKIRAAGVSTAKTAAVLDLSARVADGRLPLADVEEIKDEELITRLSEVRGIGRWTAEMFLIFQLRRTDVWPVDDYAVRKGYARIHSLPELPSPKELRPLGDPYRPYRSVAAWYCWRATEL